MLHLQYLLLDRTKDQVDHLTLPVSFHRDRSSLYHSIQEVGVITPILVRKYHEKWQIISGQGRWECGGSQVPGLEIQCSDEEALLIHVHENLARGFNPVEISRILSRLHHEFAWTLPKISAWAHQTLGLATGIKLVQDHLAILQLPEPALVWAAQENIPLRNALILLDFQSNEAIALVELCQKARWSLNKQREILALFWEIRQRDHTTIQEILQISEIQAMIQSASTSWAEELRKKIQQLKNPDSVLAYEQFTGLANRVNWPCAGSISPSPNFEQDSIQVQFSVQNPAQFAQAVDRLQKLYQEKTVDQLFDIAKGKPLDENIH